MSSPLDDAWFPRHVSFLFSKKTGAELEVTLPEALEMYRPEASSVASRSSAPRARVLWKIGHLTVHSIPDAFGIKGVVLLALATFWIAMFPMSLKIRVLLCATMYSFTEYTFTLLERGRPYTSLAQFWANLLYLPVLLDGYLAVFSNLPVLGTFLFPFNVWLLEIVEGHVIVWVYGRNVAWYYLDYTDCYCNGCVRLGHAPFWLGLGVFATLAYPLLVSITSGL